MKNDQVVLVTGCSTGFGKLAALTLAKIGYSVKASMRNTKGANRQVAEQLEAQAKQENHDLQVVDLDVLDTSSVNKAVEEIIAKSGKIDVLVNNAGVLYAGLLEAFSEEQVFNQFNTNVFSILRLNKAVLPHMRHRKNGLIITVSSIIGRAVLPFSGLYCATKFAVEALAESLRYELINSGVDSVIIEPGAYPTEIGIKSNKPSDTSILQDYGQVADLQKQVEAGINELFEGPNPPNPQEIADAIIKLIKTPAGHRPLRTVVGDDFGIDKINKTSHEVQKNILLNLGLVQLAGNL